MPAARRCASAGSSSRMRWSRSYSSPGCALDHQQCCTLNAVATCRCTVYGVDDTIPRMTGQFIGPPGMRARSWRPQTSGINVLLLGSAWINMRTDGYLNNYWVASHIMKSFALISLVAASAGCAHREVLSSEQKEATSQVQRWVPV